MADSNANFNINPPQGFNLPVVVSQPALASMIQDDPPALNIQIPNIQIPDLSGIDLSTAISRQENKQEERIPRPIVNINPEWSLKDIVDNVPHPIGWEQMFHDAQTDFFNISQKLSTKGEFYPKKEHLFNAFHLTPLDKVRVILVGQDPYPQTKKHSQEPRAQGLAFSIARDDVLEKHSVYNMFKEIKENCYPDTFQMPDHGDLTAWANQGVLLLNTCLTVSPNQPASHMKPRNLWHSFIARVINTIVHREHKMHNKQRVKPIFILLGGEAQKTITRFLGENSEKVDIIEAAHPSPLSASRFFGSKVFLKVNKKLAAYGEPIIDWNLH